MRSLKLKLMLAFLGVVLVAVGVLGLLVGQATSGAFGDYLLGRQTGDLSALDPMMEEMLGSTSGNAMLEQMLGPAEQAYLAAVNGALWIAGGLAALAALVLALLLTRQISVPLRALTLAARRMAAGDLDQRVPVRSRDELGELGRAFNAMAEAVGRQEKLRRQMAADIAHELRNPLAIIQADLEAILDGVRPLSVDTVAEAHEETRLLSRLIEDLRDLSLAEAGQLPLRKTQTDLEELARASAERFASRAESAGIDLAVEVPDALPAVDVDPDRVSQVLGNLLDNALRHTPPGGAVRVRLEAAEGGEAVRTTVRDTGSGIPPEHLPNVFERFYRADSSRTRADGGSGIGLAVVRQLVQAHGGRVRAESTPGEGTSFVFTLPSAGIAAHPAGRAETQEGWSRNGRA